MEKVLVAMSGGVDSSVAARLLQQAGYEVTGVFLCLAAGGEPAESSGCCSPTDAADARRVAHALGIDLFVLNAADAFAPVIDDFLDEYARGRTPNPCIHCNRVVKFGRLLDRADSLGVKYVASGHYARRLAAGDAGAGSAGEPGWAIHRGRAGGKDQSYALFDLPREWLGRILLPIGEVDDKDQVRRVARELGLTVHDKPDSQEVCFVPDDDYAALLARRRPEALRPGEIVDSAGHVLGRHEGYARYTIGQRRGLRVAAGVPMYVTHIDPATARVTIGPRAETLSWHLSAERANWHADVPAEFDAVVQVRYNHRGAAARVRLTGPATFDVEFTDPVGAITPGQAAVVYDADRMLGGGWIA
jgi:tRNA-specific 2-thiouridylase